MPRQITSLTLADPRVMIAAGEKRLKTSRALGASGGTVDQDLEVAEVAEAAASAFKPRH